MAQFTGGGAAPWNENSMVHLSGDMVEALHRRKIDLVLLVEDTSSFGKAVIRRLLVCHKAWRKSKSTEDEHTLDVTKRKYTQLCRQPNRPRYRVIMAGITDS